jgi:hypothetical protein
VKVIATLDGSEPVKLYRIERNREWEEDLVEPEQLEHALGWLRACPTLDKGVSSQAGHEGG